MHLHRTLRDRRSGSGSGIKSATFEIGGNDDHSSSSALICKQPTVVEGIEEHDHNDHSESESDEDDDNNSEYKKDPVDVTNVNLEEKSLVASASNVVSELHQGISDQSFSNLYQGEDETDAGNDNQSPSSATTIYRYRIS